MAFQHGPGVRPRTLYYDAGRTEVPASPASKCYLQEAEALEKAVRSRKLNADELADLGALYVRLGEPAKAVEVLRAAQREHPHHFRIVANLGTAWHVQGDFVQAIP